MSIVYMRVERPQRGTFAWVTWCLPGIEVVFKDRPESCNCSNWLVPGTVEP